MGLLELLQAERLGVSPLSIRPPNPLQPIGPLGPQQQSAPQIGPAAGLPSPGGAQQGGGGAGVFGQLFGGPNDPNLSGAQNRFSANQGLIQSGLATLLSDRGGIDALAEGIAVGRKTGGQVRAQQVARQQQGIVKEATRGLDMNDPRSILRVMSRLAGPAALGLEGAQKTLQTLGDVLNEGTKAGAAAGAARLAQRERNESQGLDILRSFDTQKKPFQKAATSIALAIDTPFGKQGVQTVIKMLEIIKEPTSIVRQSEFEEAAAVGSAIDQGRAKINRLIGTGERVTEEQFSDMIEEVKRLGSALSGFFDGAVIPDFQQRATEFLQGDSDIVTNSLSNPFASFDFTPLQTQSGGDATTLREGETSLGSVEDRVRRGLGPFLPGLRPVP